jgi:hypothetical protein
MRKRTKRLMGLVGLGVLTAGAALAFTRGTQLTLRGSLAEYLRGDEDTVVLNLPPMPMRYPGSVLMSEALLPLNLVGPADGGLTRGQQFRMTAGTTSLREASGGVAAEIFDEVTKSADLVEFEWSIEDGHVVEMSGDPMTERLAPYRSDGGDFYVVTRALEGRLKLSVRRKADAAVDAYAKLEDRVKTSADDASDAKVEISGRSSEDSRMAITLTAPTVVAFQMCKVADYGGPAKVAPAAKAPEVKAPTPESVDALLRLDPKLTPSIDEAVRQIGPEVGRAIVVAIEKRCDPERTSRATEQPKRDAKQAGPADATARPTPEETGKAKRKRKAAEANAQPAPAETGQAERNRKAADAKAQPTSTETGQAKRNRKAADAEGQPTPAETGQAKRNRKAADAEGQPTPAETGEAKRNRKAADAASDPATSVDDLIADLKPGRDRAVQLIALGALAGRGTDAASAQRAVKALLQDTNDPAVRAAAEHTLQRIRGEETKHRGEGTKKPRGR